MEDLMPDQDERSGADFLLAEASVAQHQEAEAEAADAEAREERIQRGRLVQQRLLEFLKVQESLLGAENKKYKIWKAIVEDHWLGSSSMEDIGKRFDTVRTNINFYRGTLTEAFIEYFPQNGASLK